MLSRDLKSLLAWSWAHQRPLCIPRSILAFGREIIQPVFSLFYWKNVLHDPPPIAAPKFQFSFVIAHIWHPHFLPLPTLPLYKNKAWKKTPSVLCKDWAAHCQVTNFTDLVHAHLHFLPFSFPCCSHHLGSQKRKGKSELAQQQCLDLERATSHPLNYLPSLSQ